MLNIFNNLTPFFEDCYRRISVREYAKILKISPPTASKILKDLTKEGLLKKQQDRLYTFFYANTQNWLFIDLSRSYWKTKLKNSGLLIAISTNFKLSKVILFGSLSKGEINPNSDIDVAIMSPSKPKFDYEPFEKKLGRKIQIFIFKSLEEIKNKELFENIIYGYRLDE